MKSLRDQLYKLEYKLAKRLTSEKKYRLGFLPEEEIKWFINPKVGSTFLTRELAQYDSFVIPSQHRVCDWSPMRKDWFSFAFVRHPVQRFLSCWQSKMFSDRYHIFDVSSQEANAIKSLDAFIDFVEAKSLLTCDPHLSLQSANMPVSELSFIGRLESFSADLKRLNSLTGLEINESLPSPNKTEKPTITQEQIAKIQRLYVADMNQFSYS